ncbi:MAG: metallophosphoesterase [Clostridiales bacterium]|nr:metallophosphoesterase [Clostridiales bacterium]
MTEWQIALIAVGAVAGITLIVLFLWLSNNLIKTTRYEVPLGEVEKSVKVVQISDLHGKSFGAHNAKLISNVELLAPDVIAITGDIIHRYTEKNKRVALETISALSQIAPVLYISGNHEMRNKGYRFFRKSVMEAGATVLDNAEIKVSGVTFVGLNGAHNKNDTLSKISNNTQNKVLLAHMPHCFKNYARAGYALVLSGHAHGGQWRIPFTKQGIYAPGQGMFPKYTSGIHTIGNTKMIISRGLGNSEFPLRLFNRPEIVEVTLAPKLAGSL